MSAISKPVFAVVGQPNKGKSSIVATLSEDESVAIAPTPGTTRVADRHAMSVDGEVLYELVDTPGFQRARAVLEWLEQEDVPANERAARVAEFVASHRDDARFVDECELLSPILAGAGILYVVDGAKPFGVEYEVEMQVLRWTGRPRMALINRIGPGDFVDEWRHALGQYFSIVREFDAVHADFAKRIALLRAFVELDETWRPPLDAAVAALRADDERRLVRSADIISSCVAACLTRTRTARLVENRDRETQANQLSEKLLNDVRGFESDARDEVQNVYQHGRLQRTDSESLVSSTDLFTQDDWEIFGLSRSQLLWTGVVSGALAGGGVDLVLGGASLLLLGAGVGAVIGGASTWFGGDELAKVKLLGQSLGGPLLRAGPIAAPNFPWVLLGRAWLHHRLVAERNHARREALVISVSEGTAMMDRLPEPLRRRLVVSFKKISQAGSVDEEARRALRAAVLDLLRLSD